MPHDPSRWAEKFAPILNHPEYHLATHLRSEVLVPFWLMGTEGDILEVGAGSGAGCILLKRLQPWRRVVASDVDADVCGFIAKYAEVSKVDIEVRQADVFQLPFKDDEFRACFSSGLLEHFSDTQIIDALKEQLRVASVVLTSVPTNHYYFIRGGKEYGDERLIEKLDWMNLFATAGAICEFSLTGEKAEESSLFVVITRREQ